MKPADDASPQAAFSGWPLFYTTYVSCAGLMFHFLPRSSFVIASVALTWLFFRLRQVLKRPVDDLVQLLGLDVPMTPIVSLLDIDVDSVAIHWKLPENRNSVDKYAIRVNGSIVQEVSAHETSVKVQGLQPASYYTIRVVAINAANFQAHSDAVRVKTFDSSLATDPQSRSPVSTKISVVSFRAMVEPISLASSSPSGRDHAGNYLQAKRPSGPRRPSPAPGSKATGGDGRGRSVSSLEREQEIKTLTEQLDSLGQEIQKLKREDEEDEAEFQKQRAHLLEQREAKKQKLKEREDQSKELKKNVALLEHRDTAARNRQAQQARLFDEKKREREKMKEDIARWKTESVEIEGEIASLMREKDEIIKDTEIQVQELRAEQQKEEDAYKALEDRLRDSKMVLRELENQKKLLEDDENPDRDLARQQKEDSDWAEKLRKLQMQLNQAIAERNQAHVLCQQAEHEYHQMQGRRGSQPAAFPFPGDGAMNHSDPSSSVQELPPSFSAAPFVPSLSSAILSSQPLRTGSAVPSRPSSTAFGGQVSALGSNIPPSRLAHERPLSGIEFRRLNSTDGINSPTADSLLPSDLLGDDVDDQEDHLGRIVSPLSRHNPAPSLNAPGRLSTMGSREPMAVSPLPGLVGNLAGLGQSDSTTNIPPGPTSPTSFVESQSPSSISSPHGSFANIHHYRGSDPNIDSDRRSLRSMSGSSRRPKGSKFFGSTRTRGKTTSDEPPEFGTLTKSETRSMPRQSQGENHNLPARRRLGGGGLFGMSSSVNPFGSMFGSKSSALARASAADRPQSMLGATDNSLPRLGGETGSLGWSSANDLSAMRSSNPLGNNAYSRSHLSSRRQSLIGDDGSDVPSDINEDSQELMDDDKNAPAVHAPIGTKPKDRGASQLNPKASDFQSRAWFGIGSKSDKATPKSKRKDKDKTPVVEDHHMSEDGSPSESRASRDNQSVSAGGSFESLDMIHGDGGPSSHSTPRHSFMRKLSRKGNSSNLLPTLKDKLSRSKTNAQSDETDEDPMGKSVESVMSSPAIGSEKGTPNAEKRSSGFSGIFSSKSRRKKGVEASSISEASITSAASTENVDEDGEGNSVRLE